MNFDGVMLNEHHGTPFCLGAVMDVEASILAKVTKRVKMVLLGNPVATVANPLRLAEELAMINLISGGRLVSGWVRGAGSEQFANNTNPALNRELFEEGVEFIVKAWTTPGPFRYEGKHFNFRNVNPWVLPLQRPHPPFWIPGLVSPDTAFWCAQTLSVRRAGNAAAADAGAMGRESADRSAIDHGQPSLLGRVDARGRFSVFDLASILSRDEGGRPLANPPILWDIESDPVLAETKLIAEAWDAAGLYQVGSFIGDSWKEWNGQFRDDVRSFMRGDRGTVTRLARRIMGSPDLYGSQEREPEKSVNFITCHDGFTLNDVVSYNWKHNEANGEGNRDGSENNLSWNCGVEGAPCAAMVARAGAATRRSWCWR